MMAGTCDIGLSAKVTTDFRGDRLGSELDEPAASPVNVVARPGEHALFLTEEDDLPLTEEFVEHVREPPASLRIRLHEHAVGDERGGLGFGHKCSAMASRSRRALFQAHWGRFSSNPE